MNAGDQLGQLIGPHGIVCDVSRDDFSRGFDVAGLQYSGIFFHGFPQSFVDG
jgi:hypothetical protein